MTGFSELEDQLLDAIERRGSRAKRHGSVLIVAASSAMVMALAAVAIVVLGHRQPPSPPGSPPAGAPSSPRTRTDSATGGMQLMFALPKPADQRELRYATAALYAVAKQDPACSLVQAPNRAGAAISQQAPSARMLSVLGVLRHPATARDRLPAPLDASGRPVLIGGARTVYIRYIRRVRVMYGVAYYIVPGVFGSPPAPAAVLNRCYGEEMRTLRGRLANATRSFRAATLGYGATVYAETRSQLAHQHLYEGVGELDWQLHGTGGGGGGAASPATIAQQGMLGGSGNALYGVVPSGVASVILKWPAGGRGGKASPQVLTTGVVNNMFVVRAPGGTLPPPTMVWLTANGRVIKTVPAPGG